MQNPKNEIKPALSPEVMKSLKVGDTVATQDVDDWSMHRFHVYTVTDTTKNVVTLSKYKRYSIKSGKEILGKYDDCSKSIAVAVSSEDLTVIRRNIVMWKLRFDPVLSQGKFACDEATLEKIADILLAREVAA